MKTISIIRLVACLAGGGWFSLQAQTQLLLNPGLEAPYVTVTASHTATNWTDNAYFGANLLCSQETENVHGGTNCQKVVISGLNATNSALFYQPFIFQAGDVYQAGIWLRAATNALLQFALRDANNAFQAGASSVVTIGTNWQQVVITGGFQVGTNAQFAVVFLGNGTVWIDDASVTDVTSNYLHAPPLNATSSVPATFFGMHINMLTAKNNWPPVQQGLVRLWDVGLKWSQVETNTNTYAWSHFDASTNVIYTNNPNGKVLFSFGGPPQWAALNPDAPDGQGVTNGSSSEPRNLNDWSNFVQSVATRYKGFIQYYELWNETDYKGFYSGTVTSMVAMAQIARTVITNVDASAKILGPNITLGGLSWLEQFIQAGGPPPDMVTFHDYPTAKPEASLGEVAGLRDLLSRYPAWSSLPVWCTEGAPNIGSSDAQNQGIVARCYLFWWWQNIQNWNWYAWELTNVNNTYQVPLSVSPPSETPAPGGIAYSNTVNWLLGAQMTSSSVDSNQTWWVALERQGYPAGHVVWNPGTNAIFNLPPDWNVYQQRDLSNRPTSLTGVTAITAGVAPVMLDSQPSLAVSSSGSRAASNLTWPAAATCFALYSATNLASPVWQPVTSPLSNQNEQAQVTLSPTNLTQFFRLATP